MRQPRSSPHSLVLLAAACLLAACTGTISDPGGSDNGGSGVPGGSVGQSSQAVGVSSPIRRLTRVEYDNTVRDLLGDDTHPAQAFPADEKALGIAMGGTVSALLAERYQEAAEGVAGRAVKDLSTLLPCDSATLGEDACAKKFIDGFASRAYRRPLDSDESARLVAVYDNIKKDFDFKTAIEVVIRAVLQSPNFLYVVEFGDGDATSTKVPLTTWELASRLSYFLWGSMPDETLFTAAETGELSDPGALEAQARRMLKDPRAADAVREFHEQWLELESLDTVSKDSSYYPSFDDSLRQSMKTEAETFFERVVLDDGHLDTLLTAPFSYVNQQMADFYGVSAPAKAWSKVTLDSTHRAGLLTLPALLATHAKPNQSSPVYRGKFVRETLLCQEVPAPPGNVDTSIPEPSPEAPTLRDRIASHLEVDACANCHLIMDPPGLTLEQFDGLGRFRTTEAGATIDVSGDIDGDAFEGLLGLAGAVREHPDFSPCMVDQVLRFGLGREIAPARLEGGKTEDFRIRERLRLFGQCKDAAEHFVRAKGVRDLLILQYA